MTKLHLYAKHYRALFDPLHDMMIHGIRVDEGKFQARYTELREQCRELAAEINRLSGCGKCTCGCPLTTHPERTVNVWEGVLTKAGKPRKPRYKKIRGCLNCSCTTFVPKVKPLMGAKDVSAQKLAAYLYDHLGLPEQMKRNKETGEEKRTADEAALLKLRKVLTKYIGLPKVAKPQAAKLRWKRRPKAARRIIDAVLEYRGAAKLSSFCNAKAVDADGYVRCSYKVTTITGRLASSSNPYGTGYNLQNVDKRVRDCFIPDPGCIFLEADYSMGETRLLYALTGDPRLVEIANSYPAPGRPDIYEMNAGDMYGCDPLAVPKDLRQNSKTATLALGYGMEVDKFHTTLTLQGRDVTIEEVAELHAAYFRARPQIPDYHRWIRQQVMRKRMIHSPFGRVLDLRNQRLAQNVYNQAYDFIPQSTLGDMLNTYGLAPTWKWLRAERMRSRITLQVHDALVLNTPPEETWACAQKLRELLERPVTLETILGTKVQLTIPIAIKVGVNWAFDEKKGEAKEWKVWPSEEEFQAELQKLTPAH